MGRALLVACSRSAARAAHDPSGRGLSSCAHEPGCGSLAGIRWSLGWTSACPGSPSCVLLAGGERGGVLTHMTIYARDGFGLDEQRALAGLRKIFKPGQGGDLRVLLETVTCLENHAGPLAQGLYGTLGPTRRWTSATPFCPTRHSKPRPGKRLENQVRIWLDGLGLPSPSAVRIEDRQAYAHSPRGTAWSRFQRLRKGEPEPILARGVSRCLGVELEFPEPVAGPIAIGHQCHFGLGRFEPRSS